MGNVLNCVSTILGEDQIWTNLPNGHMMATTMIWFGCTPFTNLLPMGLSPLKPPLWMA